MIKKLKEPLRMEKRTWCNRSENRLGFENLVLYLSTISTIVVAECDVFVAKK